MAVSITDAFTSIELDLWGDKFETKEVMPAAQKKMDKLRDEINEIEQSVVDEDGQVTRELTEEEQANCLYKLAETLDYWIGRLGDDTGPKPSTIIKKRLKDEKLSRARLLTFIENIGKALEAEAGDPTRPTQG